MYGGYESGHRYHNIFSVCSGLLFYYESITSSNVPVINKAHFKYGVDKHLNIAGFGVRLHLPIQK